MNPTRLARRGSRVVRSSVPLSFIIGPRSEHYSRKIIEIVKILEWEAKNFTQILHRI
ncbi:MAG: hypothetical protein QXP57_07095 [Nitrososphaerota archaeon]